ncbi:MAG TPA: LiaF domain-containing protein [Ktedonobacterales bacterium]|nr:LiaF domain-containing protein [Ktedonobacterales bacterium]
MDSTTPLQVAQRQAIDDVRARYIHGAISFEEFERALDAVVHAQTAQECQAILNDPPVAPNALLNVLDRPFAISMPGVSTPSSVPNSVPQQILAIMGQTKKTRRAWTLAPTSETLALMGEVQLDLRQAALPAQGRMRLRVIMGTTIILIPSNVQVTVHARGWLSGMYLLGEQHNGVVTFGEAQHFPADETALAHLDIEVFTLMGNVQIKLANGSMLSIGELTRQALQAIATGVQRGLQQGANTNTTDQRRQPQPERFS